MLEHAGAKFGAFGDIGRIAQHEVEPLGHLLRPVAAPELRARRKPEPLGIARRISQRRLTRIDAKAGRARPLIERGEQQRTGTGAEIEDAFGPVSPGKMLAGRLDQRLAVGPRDQGAGADLQFDVPERPAPDDVGDRLPRTAPLQEFGEFGRAPALQGAAISVRRARSRRRGQAAIRHRAAAYRCNRGVAAPPPVARARPASWPGGLRHLRARPAAAPHPRRSARR